jgi:DNA-binding NarL/FixJ family response regulator
MTRKGGYVATTANSRMENGGGHDAWRPELAPTLVTGARAKRTLAAQKSAPKLVTPPSSDRVAVALVGGQCLLREATASLLAKEENLEVLGSFESSAEYLADGSRGKAAVLLLDCDEDPQYWQCEGTTLASADPQCSIVLMCRDAREDVIRWGVTHRVRGILLKSYSRGEIRDSISYMATGRTVMPAGWQRALAHNSVKALQPSPRQRQILALIAQGRRNREIAVELGLSPNTVKFHIRELYARLGVRNRVEAVNRHTTMTDAED